MTTRRPLASTLVEIAGAAMDALAAGPPLTLRSLSVTLPLEIVMLRREGGWEVLGDVPRTRTRTAFDITPVRLDILWVAGEPA